MQNDNSKFKIIFIGTGEFGAIILEKLCQTPYKPSLVVTGPDKPVGRKQILTSPPVKAVVENYKIPFSQPKKISDFTQFLAGQIPDLIILADYGKIIPKEILNVPKYGCFNIHPSLLSRWRGSSPIQFTILNNERETGVTIILMDEKVDHGPIIANEKLKMKNEKLTYEELLRELANLGAVLLIETIPKWLNGEIKPIPQDESKVTYAKLLKKEDGKIDWTKSAEEIERQIRAFYPWPGTFAKIQNDKSKFKIIKILKADVLITQKEKKIGEVFLTDDKKLAVQTGQNCLILRKLQLEGKKPINFEEFLLGHKDFIGKILC